MTDKINLAFVPTGELLDELRARFYKIEMAKKHPLPDEDMELQSRGFNQELEVPPKPLPPKLDWTLFAPYHNSACMLSNGSWILFTGVTKLSDAKDGWVKAGQLDDMPSHLIPRYWTGDWKDSLIVRPGAQ